MVTPNAVPGRAAVPGREARGLPAVSRAKGDYPACWSWRLPAGRQVERIRRRYQNLAGDRDCFRWLLMVEWQGDRCAICGHAMGARFRRDHDHVSGLFRGFLCPGCNTSEGVAPSVPRYVNYRLRNPAVIFNVKYRYAPLDEYRGKLVPWHLLPDR